MQKRRSTFETVTKNYFSFDLPRRILLYIQPFSRGSSLQLHLDFRISKKCQHIDLANSCSWPPLVYLLIAQTCVFVYDLFSFLYNPDSVRFSAKVFTESAIQDSPGFGLWRYSAFTAHIIINLILLCFFTRPQKRVPIAWIIITCLVASWVEWKGIWARIFKRLWSSRIDAKEWIPPAYVACRAGTITIFLLGS